MKEVIIGLAGVVLGGLIGIIGQFFVNYFDNKRWQKEKQIEYLRVRRSELESKYEKCIKSLYESFESNTYNASSFFDTLYLFPDNVKEAYRKVGGENDVKIKQKNVWNVEAEMKKSLVEIDKQIDNEIKDINVKIFIYK